MTKDSETITAITTAAGEAGIAIVRLSGPRAMDIADALYDGPAPAPSLRSAGTFLRCFIKPTSGVPGAHVDEVILLIYRAPHSYTCEDVVEIQGHGGRICAKRILRATLEAGARLAEPGEFTRRAFLNGRIDLLQAEAVADLIRAQSDRAAGAAMEQLDGNLTSVFTAAYDALIAAAADLEATLDFSEDELPAATMPEMVVRLEGIRRGFGDLLNTWEEGHLLREGALVAIAGRPNVGKSTLLNYLLGSARAIVTDKPGTTRDTIEEQLVLDGVPLRLVDTAGLREADCHIEREGIQRAQSAIQRADLILYVLDASQPLSSDDRASLAQLGELPRIILLNKIDLGKKLSAADFPCHRTVACSLLDDAARPEIRRAILDQLGMYAAGPPHAVISERHRSIIQTIQNELNSSSRLLSAGREENIVLAADHLRGALEELGLVTGRLYSNELLDNIFSRFCVGK